MAENEKQHYMYIFVQKQLIQVSKPSNKIIYKTIDDYVYNIIYLLCHRDVLRFLWHFVRNAGSTKNKSPANKATPPDTRNDTVQSPVTSLIHPTIHRSNYILWHTLVYQSTLQYTCQSIY